MTVFDEKITAQVTVRDEYSGFLEVIAQIDDDYVSEAQDIQSRINLVKKQQQKHHPCRASE